MKKTALIAFFALAVFAATAHAGSAVVTNGRFTNVYVYPDPDRETWDQHMAKLRPGDADKFSRANIDKFTAEFMQPAWPSYFDPLYQYSGINPPQFFGSSVASQSCVDAALKDLYKGIMQWDTIRSLSNCHESGMDPSPQVTLIFSPDIKVGKITPFGTTDVEMCSQGTWAWHAWGLNTPNFIALPTGATCAKTFTDLTEHMSHEVVETISDPAGMGMGTLGEHELADNCESKADAYTVVNGHTLARYWSNFDNNCQPRLDPPDGSVARTWVMGQGNPLTRFTGSVHLLELGVPKERPVTDARVTRAVVVIQTGGDDIRGGSNPGDNANVTLNFKGGNKTTVNVNAGRSWENGETHAVELALPNPAPRMSDITGLSIATNFGGGIGGDNWNVNKVALVLSFPSGSTVTEQQPPVVHDWLNVSGGPLVRFTGSVHDYGAKVNPQDDGKLVSALDLIISTGNDDLRGGSNPGDNCDVIIELSSGKSIIVNNVNRGQDWQNWTDNTVSIPLPAGGLKGGEVKSVTLHTGFGGGIGGDNWNVNRIQLKATLSPENAAPKRASK